MRSNGRLEKLREIEIIVYRLCYGLLQSESLAHEAAKELLMRLFRDGRNVNFTGAAYAEHDAKLLRREAASVCSNYLSRAQ
ncbi:hypothetical protein [Paenibacillus sp. NEAU-GSW1]|uniref:hypothetical protein n=1 Tax=Paenibacillus sp. NEAU-GSW1 TaxID=2682486 RepID=UPI0012E0FB67|nr:hypothetical protein [Paenibacillus sp. NEAU-GSW1]MUT65275.1 hypothetical protein [Paenibacillus sp. NEAU-GSW1]